METEKIKNLIYQVKNPQTGKSLQEEGRITELKLEQDTCTLIYKRDGISPEQKRSIEDDVFEKIAPELGENNIIVKTVSENSNDVYKNSTTNTNAKQQAPAASLQAGHGPSLPQKKSLENVKATYAISSGKGGVGKSTVTANLAISLSRLGYKVGVIDADIYGPSMPMLMGKRGAKPSATEDKRINPIDVHGIKFISFGLFINENDPVIWRGPMLGGVLNQFLFDVEWGELDFLLIDMPPGTGDMQLSLSQLVNIDGAFVVTTPQDIALLDSRKGLEMFKQVKIDVLGIIENMSYFVCHECGTKHDIFGSGGSQNMEKETEVPTLGNIPLERSLREASDKGVPYMSDETHKDMAPWKSYLEIAEKLVKISKGEKKTSFFSKLFN